MTLKQLIGYGLTALVAAWGLVYAPWQDLNAVKPYVANPMGALHYYPLFLIAMIPIAGAFTRWMTPAEDRKGYKRFILVPLWIGSLISPFVEWGNKDTFLSRHEVWAGTCYVTGGDFLRLDPQVDVICGNGAIVTVRDASFILRDAFFGEKATGRKVACSIKAIGTADCEP